MENIKTQLHNFDLEALEKYLLAKTEYKNIALQFDENLTNISIKICGELKEQLPDKFIFIVGESCYGQCCADEIAALHLNAHIIVRIGDSCLTKNKQLPVYFLYENLVADEIKIKNHLLSIELEEDNNLFVFYDPKYTKVFSALKEIMTELNEKIKISSIPFQPDMYNEYNEQEDLLIYSRIFKEIREFKKNDKIVYYGEENDKLIGALCLQYVNSNKIFLIDCNNNGIDSMKELSTQLVNSIYYKRFNLIQKAKESEVFGIIVGSLSISGLNKILDEVKHTLKLNNKKYYTFLLGKITLEKLSNFVEFIDCFVLIACPFSDFYNFKTLYKPMVAALDIEIAFNDEIFKWDMSYTFDPSYIITKGQLTNVEINEKEEETSKTISVGSQFTGLKLTDSEKNSALANIFSIKTLENYDKRQYKGLNLNEIKGEVQKFKLGKTGIPLKYEDIKE